MINLSQTSIYTIPPGWALQLATRNATIFSRLPILRGLHQKGLKHGQTVKGLLAEVLSSFLWVQNKVDIEQINSFLEIRWIFWNLHLLEILRI